MHSRNSSMVHMHGIPGSIEQDGGDLGAITNGRYTKLASLDQDPSPGMVSCRPRGPGSVSPGNSPGSRLGPSLLFESRDDALEVSATPPPRRCNFHAQGATMSPDLSAAMPSGNFGSTSGDRDVSKGCHDPASGERLEARRLTREHTRACRRPCRISTH